MNMLTRKLIAKDFYLNRWLIVGSTVAGLVALLVAAEGKVRFNIGMLTWLTTIVAFGVMLAMVSIGNERKERTLQFVLSLPLSHGDYVRIKVVGLLLCFLVPWFVLSAGAVTLVLVSPICPTACCHSPCCCADSSSPTSRSSCVGHCTPGPRA